MSDKLGARHTLRRLAYYDPKLPGTIHLFQRREPRGAIAGWLAYLWEFLLGK
jgi:hypothetical protein